jgi:hypothetical protein
MKQSGQVLEHLTGPIQATLYARVTMATLILGDKRPRTLRELTMNQVLRNCLRYGCT